MKYLITIIGPTAIGKTALSIQLANHFDCEIVSGDSRQFFKEITIGTAAPSQDELASAKHHFIQSKSIFEPYSVGDFEKEGIVKIEELFQVHDYVILVGGSGLYINAILKGFDSFPEIDPSIRTDIYESYKKLGLPYLLTQFQKLDPIYFETLTASNPQTLQNPQRLMRFVEVCLGSGKPYSDFLNQKQNKRNFHPILIGLEADRELLYKRINERVDSMLHQGLLKEAESVYSYKGLNSMQTVGYKELFSYIDGEIPLDMAVDEIKKNTRHFAKRQLTWFKRLENTKWFDFETPVQEIIHHIEVETRN